MRVYRTISLLCPTSNILATVVTEPAFIIIIIIIIIVIALQKHNSYNAI